MRALLTEGRLSAKIMQDKDGVTNITLSKQETDSLRLDDWLERRQFCPKLLALSKHSARIFAEELPKWDGSQLKDETNRHYNSTNKQSADWAQIMSVLAGFRCQQVRLKETRENRNDVFRLYQADSLITDFGTPAQEHYYDGWVYCVTVPSGFFLIRRNGKVSVTGNSEVADILNQWGFIPLDQFIERNNLKSRINMQVHDEVLVSVTRDEAWDIARFLRDSIEREREYDGISLKMPVTFAVERRYHTEEVEFKRLPDDKAEWDAKFDPLWETRIK